MLSHICFVLIGRQQSTLRNGRAWDT